MEDVVSVETLHGIIRGEVNRRAGEINDFAACHNVGILINTRYVNDNPRLPMREINVPVLTALLEADPRLVIEPADGINGMMARVLNRMDEIRGIGKAASV